MNKGKFLLGSLFGAVAGVIGGLLFAPQSGVETRKDLERAFSAIPKDPKISKTYAKVQAELSEKLHELKVAGEEIDFKKYQKLISQVVANAKEELSDSKNGVSNITNYLQKDWQKLKAVLNGEAEVKVVAKRKPVKKAVVKKAIKA